jgi:precorrin-2 dehydrogenase/sirohydrochlorin ferrochelatase
MSSPLVAGFNPHFQIGLDVAARRCLVVGGGHEALDKTQRLLDAGAHVVVVTRSAAPKLQALAAAGRIELRLRAFRRTDLRRTRLVVNTAVGDPRIAARVWRSARRRKVLINTYDTPSQSTVAMAALVKSGHLRISVSTSNASPALAGKLRRGLTLLFDDTFDDYLEALGRVRRYLRESEPDRARRIALLQELVADFRIAGELHYPEGWRLRMQEILEPSTSQPAPR